MNSKEITKLIERAENAQRVTETLCEKSSKFAKWIHGILLGNGEQTLLGGRIEIGETYTSVGTARWIRLDDRDIDCDSIGDGVTDYLYWQQYGASYQKATRSDILSFLAETETILKELADLDKVETPEILETLLGEV